MPDVVATPAEPVLKRSLTLIMLVLYGLGVTVGAGIYVLIGAAASRAGPHAPVSFLLAAVVMALTAASFAELSARMPVSAGEAAYVEAGLRSPRLGLVVGLLVVGAAVISTAAIAQGAAGYLGVLIKAPEMVLTVGVIVSMGLIAAWGITEAVWLAAIMTVIEIGGLLVIVAAGLWTNPAILAKVPEMWTGLGAPAAWPGIFGATMLAFFAFIGFEAIVNVAEETHAPERTMPLAIAVTLVAATILYILVIWVAINAVPRAELAASAAPLSLVFERLTGFSPFVITLIAIFATINGIIVQIVLSARVFYGMAAQGSLPSWLAGVHPVTKTPLAATVLSVALVLICAVALPIEELADNTTRVMLVVFALVNLALLAMKRRGDIPGTGFVVQAWVPAAGALSCIGLLVADVLR